MSLKRRKDTRMELSRNEDISGRKNYLQRDGKLTQSTQGWGKKS